MCLGKGLIKRGQTLENGGKGCEHLDGFFGLNGVHLLFKQCQATIDVRPKPRQKRGPFGACGEAWADQGHHVSCGLGCEPARALGRDRGGQARNRPCWLGGHAGWLAAAQTRGMSCLFHGVTGKGRHGLVGRCRDFGTIAE